MAVEHLSVTLQVWRFTGSGPKPAEFLNQLIVDPSDGVKTRKTPNARADLFLIERSEFAGEEEPSEAFAAEVKSRLEKAATWLSKQPIGLFEGLRSQGFRTGLLFSGWIDCDQMDLDFPPVLLQACGRHGLTISIITND